MRHRLRQTQRCSILLIFALLFFGAGSRVTLCLAADGSLHMEQVHSPCDSDGQQETVAATGSHEDLADNHGACLDLTLSEEASPHLQRALRQLPPPCLVPLAPAVHLSHFPPLPPLEQRPCITPSAIALTTVVLLI